MGNIKDIFTKIRNTRINIFIYRTTESEWTVYKRFLLKNNVDTKLVEDIVKLYGHNFCNLVEYKKDGKDESGNIIYKIATNG